MCSVLVQLNGDVIAAYMSAYGNIKEVTMVWSIDGMAHGDFVLDICLNRKGFSSHSSHINQSGPADDGGHGGQEATLLVLQTTGPSCLNLPTKVIKQQPKQQQQPGKDLQPLVLHQNQKGEPR